MAGLFRFRMLPWLVLFEAARTLHTHLGEHLSPDDRRRVTEIVRQAKGDPRRVTAAERSELKRIASGLRISTLGRELIPTLLRASGRKRS